MQKSKSWGSDAMALKKERNLGFKPVSLGVQVAEILSQAILEGDFKGGDQLVETDLQAHFGMSRSPLREAFRELEKKGLVEIIPRRGTFVKRISRKDVEENFPARAALEGLAAELAAKNMNSDALDRMTETLGEMAAAVQNQDTQAFYTHHLNFHEIFIGLSGNEVIENLLKTLRMQALWHRFSYQYYQEDLEKSYQVHREILNLFKNKKTASGEIRALVEHHINVALERFLVYLENFERE